MHSIHGRVSRSPVQPAMQMPAPSVSYGRGWRMINIQLRGRSSSCSSEKLCMRQQPLAKVYRSLLAIAGKTLLIALIMKIKGKPKQHNIMNARKEAESISSNFTFAAVFSFPLLFDLVPIFARQRVPSFDLIMLALNE